jgi:hypothetical protein
MPLFLEPDQRFPIVLDSDKDKPKETRPTFFAKSHSMRSQRKLSEQIDAAFESGDVNAIYDANSKLLFENLVDWQNMGGYSLSLESIQEVLNFQEVRELLRKITSNQHLGPEEKKG